MEVEDSPVELPKSYASIVFHGNTVGLCVLSPRPRTSLVDIKRHELKLFQFVDCVGFTTLESLLLQVNPQV